MCMLSYTVQDVLIRFADRYIAAHEDLPLYIKIVLCQLVACRTPLAGRHDQYCPHCGFRRSAYNSCRNRNCPTCQSFTSMKWVEQRLARLPRTPYFHLTFTIPHELNPFFMGDARTDLLNLLLSCSAEAISELTMDPKYLGARIGMISTVHTWGQTLAFHPHVHMLASGGGLTLSNEWNEVKKPTFFVPNRVAGKLFRGKFMDGFKKLFPSADRKLLKKLTTNNWNVHIKPCTLEDPSETDEVLSNLLFDMDEHTYTMDISDINISNFVRPVLRPIEPPFEDSFEHPFEDDAVTTLKYVAKGMFNPAITDNRITNITDETVSFKYIDYSDGNKVKEMTLHWEEFMRRFVMHILPRFFKKTRYYGIFAPKASAKYLSLCMELTKTPERKCPSTEELLRKTLGPDFDVCPDCGSKLIPITENYDAISKYVHREMARDKERMQKNAILRKRLCSRAQLRNYSSA